MSKPHNIIVTNNGHTAEGKKLVSLLNRNNEYIVCDVSMNEEINKNQNIWQYISPFNLMLFDLLEKVELCNKIKKPLLIYSFPERPSFVMEYMHPAFRFFEYCYLCSFIHPFGFVNVEVIPDNSTPLSQLSMDFPTVQFNPGKKFLVDLLDDVEKAYQESYDDKFISMLNVFNSYGFYMSMKNDPDEIVKVSSGTASLPILPHEYIKILYEKFKAMEEAGEEIGSIIDKLEKVAFVRAYTPVSALLKKFDKEDTK